MAIPIELGSNRYLFEGPRILIGRASACDLILGPLTVSRQHARIALEGEDFVVEDLGSANGTLVSGAPALGTKKIARGEPVEIGPFTLKIGATAEGFEPVTGSVRHADLADPNSGDVRTMISPAAQKPADYNTDVVFAGPPAVLPQVSTVDGEDDGVPSVIIEPRLEVDTDPAAESSAILEPDTLISNRFRVIRHVARGGFAHVYLVEDTTSWLDQKIALKIPIAGGDPRELANQLKSTYKYWKILSDVAPDRFVRLIDIAPIELGSPGEHAVGIQMEYMRGGSLHRMVTKEWGGRPKTRDQLATLVRFFLQACDAVRFMHNFQEGFVHRDVKPANMLLHAGHCKLADFELVSQRSPAKPIQQGGTIPYMAPECFEGVASIATDIFALGASFFHLLYGHPPFGSIVAKQRAPLEHLEAHNPLVSAELHRLVLACLEPDPENRPQSVEDFMRDLRQLGLTDDDANTAPVVLARLLLKHLDPGDVDHMVRSLEGRGFRSHREGAEAQRADVIEEYCYAEPPHEVLAQHCTARQAAEIARALGLEELDEADRDSLFARILEAIGFRSAVREIPGIEPTRAYVEKQLLDLLHATSTDECVGMTLSALLAVEKIVDILVRFFGQLVHGAALAGVIARKTGGKSIEEMGFGQRVGVLRDMCVDPPKPRPRDRNAAVFTWPIIDRDTFEGLDALVGARNELAHRSQIAGIRDAQRNGRTILSLAVEVLASLADNPLMPRCVQITSRQDDVYGRHFYLGRDDRGRSERIFTPLPLEVGRIYLIYALTNPVRINPAIFPLDP